MDEIKSSSFKERLAPVKSLLLSYPIVSCIVSGIVGFAVMVAGIVVLLDVSMESVKPFFLFRILIALIGSLLVLFSIAFSIWNIKKTERKLRWFYILWGILMAFPSIVALYMLFTIVISIPLIFEQHFQ